MTTNVAILLGAGSSIPAGFPSAEKLTDLILSGHNYPTQNDGNEDTDAKFVNCLITILHNEAKKYKSGHSKKINYEDLFFLAEQVLTSHRGSIENPAIVPFINEIKPFINILVSKFRAENSLGNEIEDKTIFGRVRLTV